MAEEKQFETSSETEETQQATECGAQDAPAQDVSVPDSDPAAGEDVPEDTPTDASEDTAEKEAQPQTENSPQADEPKAASGKKKSSGSRKPKKTIKGLEMELKAQSEIIDDLSAQLKDAQEAGAQAQDKYQRLMAEFENMRKRTEKEAKHMYDVGAKEVLEKLLPVVDNFERAQQSLSEEQKEDAFVQGVDKIYRQLLDYLKAVKVEPMNAEGQEFNPDLHNAVMHVEDENYDDNVVVEELQKGYLYKEEVLRHSMVKVAN